MNPLVLLEAGLPAFISNAASLPPIWVLASAFVATVLAATALIVALDRQARLYRQRFAAGVESGLQQAFLFIDARRLFQLNLLGVVLFGALAYLATGQVIAVVLVLMIAGAMPAIVLRHLKTRRLKRFALQFPDAVMLVAGSLRGGSSLPQSIAMVAGQLSPPASQEFSMVVREQRLGVPIDGSMANLERRVPLPEVSLFAAAVRIAQEAGGNLAETLERLSDTLRRKLAVEGKIDALTSQGRLQGWVMALLPIGIAAALFAIEPDAMSPLVTTWYGWLVCAGVLSLEVAGLHFIRRIVRIDV